MATFHPLTTTCLCSTISQPIHPHPQVSPNILPHPASMCHCRTCRKTSGVLFASYFPISTPPSLDSLSVYKVSSSRQIHGRDETRYFCQCCGCHVFRSHISHAGKTVWEVATGTLNTLDGIVRWECHEHVAETKDGGAAVWIRECEGRELVLYKDSKDGLDGAEEGLRYAIPERQLHQLSPSAVLQVIRPSLGFPAEQEQEQEQEQVQPKKKRPESRPIIRATCHCSRTTFHLTRPNASSLLPRSNFSDCLIAYHTSSPKIPNPDDEKWWLRGPKAPNSSKDPANNDDVISTNNGGLETRYLGGTCACKSCRLATGFEIQTWAFVPRSNILFADPAPGRASLPATSSLGPEIGGEGLETAIPLDFGNAELMSTTGLRSYESSPGVVREFCATCGATAFWHDRWRPDLVDVSVGLLDEGDGVKAEEWLDWCTERVSFEEVENSGREDGSRGLIEGLKRGLGTWAAARGMEG